MRISRYNNSSADRSTFNSWDIIVAGLIIILFWLSAWSIGQMGLPLDFVQHHPISLDVSYLPGYTFRSIVRMLIGLVLSLLFTFCFGTWAARSARAERIIIPLIDICQSVPILGFLTLFSWGLLMLFPGSIFGAECAAIFAIFTSQVWNMTFSFYQSLKNIPKEYLELCAIYRISPWKKFFAVDIPYALPSLAMNMMLSLSASWFFVVASEVINFQIYSIKLPGIGSYIQQADDVGDVTAIAYALLAMLIAIILCNQLIFNPLLHWIDRYHNQSGQVTKSWVVNLFAKTKWIKSILNFINQFLSIKATIKPEHPHKTIRPKVIQKAWLDQLWDVIETILIIGIGSIILCGLFYYTSLNECITVIYYGFLTFLRIVVMLSLAIAVWVPVGVWIGLNSKVSKMILPVIQILAAFPVNLVYPLMTLIILRYHLNPEIWVSPLIILGTQWYILFNVIAGTMSIPKELRMATRSLHLKSWSKWRSLILPAIAPDLLTGVITAAGGAWNASIVAEYITWNGQTIIATGIGAYITDATYHDAYQLQALGIIIMCLYVIIINRFIWAPLYQLTQNRFSL